MNNLWSSNLSIDKQYQSIEKAEETLEHSRTSLKKAAHGTQLAAFELITDLKTAVEGREKKYQVLVENIQDGMYVLHNKKFIFANNALCNMVGLKKQEIIGKELADIVNVSNDYCDMISTNSSGHREYTIKYVTRLTNINKIVTVWETLNYDKEFANELGCDIIDDEQTENVIAIGTVKDITSEIETEHLLKAFSSAINNSSDAIMVVSFPGNILFVNNAFENTYGYTLQEIAGKNPNILKSNIHSIDFYKRMWETLLFGQEWRGVIFNKTKDGRIVEDDTKIIPFMNGIDVPLFFMAIKKIRRIYSSLEAADILNWNDGKVNRS